MNYAHNVIKSVGLVVASLTLVSFPAQAIELSSSTGSWTSVSGVTNINGLNTNQVRWGVPSSQGTGDQSGLGFVGSAPPTVSLPLDTLFVLGTLTHYNYRITAGSSSAQSQSDLTIALNIANAGETINPNFNYNFNIDETLNYPTLAQCGSSQISNVPCDDIITLVNPQQQTFTLNGNQYQLAISGFSNNPDGSSPFAQFITTENQQSNAYLVGQITDVTPVPWETDALSVVGTTILFAGGVWRKYKLGKKIVDKDR